MSASTAVDLPALDLPAGLFGFPDAHRFALVEWGEPGLGLFLLRCLDTEGLEFLVAAPHALFPYYAPEIPDADADRLGLTDPPTRCCSSSSRCPTGCRTRPRTCQRANRSAASPSPAALESLGRLLPTRAPTDDPER